MERFGGCPMSDDDVEAVNHLQEPPSTSLTGTPLAMYRLAKMTIEEWDPVPPPEKEEE